ncbi:MAG: SRPBCC domain-containing protein [Saprospiraceae bacterium]|nr:SRPBCC domain-containing protein [Saprospiraceae bacterium]
MDLKDRTLTIERTFDAPLALVWEAWTQADHIAAWWGPKGMPFEVVVHDFRVGGRWQYVMQMPNGQSFIAEGVYQEIVEREKMVTTANFRPMTEGVIMESHFTADGDRTRFTFHVIHPTVEYCRQQEAMGFYNGWGTAFERLAQHLEEG